MSTLADIQDTFAFLESWEEKYRYLIELGRGLPPMPEEEKIDANLVRGCTSRVWMTHHLSQEKIAIHADSDAAIVKGLVAVLLAIYDGQPLSALTADKAKDVFTALDLQNHLSPSRSNGFFAMVERIVALRL